MVVPHCVCVCKYCMYMQFILLYSTINIYVTNLGVSDQLVNTTQIKFNMSPGECLPRSST